jgi:ketosteroid isomerase-like protein
MPSGHSELMRRCLAAFDSGDVEALVAELDPDVEWRTEGAFAGVDMAYHGHDGVRRWFREMKEPWQELGVDGIEYAEAGDEVLIGTRLHGRSREGLEVELVSFAVCSVRDGKLARWEGFRERGMAVGRIGLDE